MFRIVEESKVLDVNSSYSYLLWGKYFNKTSIIATCDDEVVGFITGFIPPEQADTLFIWQVAVDANFRGYGLATHLIHQLLTQVNDGQDVDYVEATVTPSNVPSSKLFQGIAKKNDTECAVFECFSEGQFPGEGHEAELTYKIGPIEID